MSHPSYPPADPKAAKAQAKADKAYRKASRPFYKKPLFILLAIIAVIIIIVVANGGGDDSSSSSSGAATGAATSSPSAQDGATAQTSAEAAPAPADDPLSDGDWTISDIQAAAPQFGTSTVTARVTNNGADSRSGLFTVTVFDGTGARIGNVSGAANSVEAGGTQTVTFLSATELPGDPSTFTYEFQNDASY